MAPHCVRLTPIPASRPLAKRDRDELPLTVYTVEDKRVRHDALDLARVPPLERRGVVSDIRYGIDDLPITRVAAEILSISRWVTVRPMPMLTVGRVTADLSFHSDHMGGGTISFSLARGSLTNPLDSYVGDVQIVAIVVDKVNRVVGGSVKRPPSTTPGVDTGFSTAVFTYGIDIESRNFVGASWGHVEVFAVYF